MRLVFRTPRLADPLRRLWCFLVRRFPPHSLRRRALTGLFIVLVCEAGLYFAVVRGWFPQAEEAAIDSMMRRHVGFARADGDGSRAPPGFALIDVDDATWADWGNPTLFPKGRLVPLIDYAANAGARAIVVDVDTSDGARGCAGACAPLGGDVADQQGQELAWYIQDYRERGGGRPPLILVRSFEAPGGPEGTIRVLPGLGEPTADGRPDYWADAESGYWAEGQPVYWAASAYNREPDMALRRWRLWEVDCSGEVGRPVPSVELTTLAALQGPAVVRSLWTELRERTAARCRGHTPAADTITVGDRTLKLADRGLGERILYTLTYDTLDEPLVRVGDQRAPMLRIIPANAIRGTDAHDSAGSSDRRGAGGTARPGYSVSSDPVRGRIVVIGASAWGARDLHATPVGGMPGALVVTNAISTMVQFDQLHHLTLLQHLMVGVPVGMAVWALLEFLHLSIAVVVCGLLVSFASFVLSRHWLGQGLWLDALLPSLGLLLHRWIVVFEGLWDKRHLKWRALLSAHMQARLAGKTDAGKAGETAGLLFLVAVAVLWGQAAVAEAPRVVAGRVVAMPGAPNDYRIQRRDGTRVEPAYYMDLLEGDRIEVRGDKPISVRLPGEARPITVERGRPLTVPTPLAALPLLDASMQRLMRWISSQKSNMAPQPPVNAMTRGEGDIEMAVLDGRRRFVAAGQRSLHIVWSGGAPAYRVRLSDAAGRVIGEASDLPSPRLELRSVALAPGLHTISITDASERQARDPLVFEVVPQGRVPSPPPEMSQGLPDDDAAVATAVWLAGREDGRWSYEALNRAAPLAGTVEPAGVLVEALARGRIPNR